MANPLLKASIAMARPTDLNNIFCAPFQEESVGLQLNEGFATRKTPLNGNNAKNNKD